MQYVHGPLGEEVEFLAGSYRIDAEERLPYQGGDVFCLLGSTSAITSCCGSASPFSFIKVVGLVKNWRESTDAKGRPVTEVDPVRGEPQQQAVRQLVHREHPDVAPLHIEFW